MTDHLPFIQAIYDRPGDYLPLGVFGDFLDETTPGTTGSDVRGLLNHNLSDFDYYGDGGGDGYGGGYGGYGYGYGYGGYGYGYGYGDGDGGYGYGGYGYGYGKRNLFTKNLQEAQETDMRPGQNYLFLSGFGWAWVGTYVGPNGLGTHAVANASNLCRTMGVSWFHLAKGERRGEPVVRTCDGEITVPTPVAIPWSGEVYTKDQN